VNGKEWVLRDEAFRKILFSFIYRFPIFFFLLISGGNGYITRGKSADPVFKVLFFFSFFALFPSLFPVLYPIAGFFLVFCFVSKPPFF